jgi:hypothetical protein
VVIGEFRVESWRNREPNRWSQPMTDNNLPQVLAAIQKE